MRQMQDDLLNKPMWIKDTIKGEVNGKVNNNIKKSKFEILIIQYRVRYKIDILQYVFIIETRVKIVTRRLAIQSNVFT